MRLQPRATRAGPKYIPTLVRDSERLPGYAKRIVAPSHLHAGGMAMADWWIGGGRAPFLRASARILPYLASRSIRRPWKACAIMEGRHRGEFDPRTPLREGVRKQRSCYGCRAEACLDENDVTRISSRGKENCFCSISYYRRGAMRIIADLCVHGLSLAACGLGRSAVNNQSRCLLRK